MRVPICGKSNVGTAGADWLLVIYFIACFNTDNLKISGFRERKKKVKNLFAMQDRKDILKYTSIISSLMRKENSLFLMK